MMMREFAHMVGGKPGDPLELLVLASMFRDDVPWLYELASDAYRSIRERRPDASHALQRFRRAVEVIAHGRFPIDVFGLDPDMVMMAMDGFERHFLSADEGEDEKSVAEGDNES
jgi:hypothetical protein